MLGPVLVMGSSSERDQPAVRPSAPGVPLVQEDAPRGQVRIFCLQKQGGGLILTKLTLVTDNREVTVLH